MRVVIIWRDETDYARTVIEWLHDFEKRTGTMPESLSPDEPEGVAAKGAHLRVDDGQHGRGRDGGLHGVAAAAQHVEACSAGKVVGRRDHAPQGHGIGGLGRGHGVTSLMPGVPS